MTRSPPCRPSSAHCRGASHWGYVPGTPAPVPACFCGQVGSVQRLSTPHPRGWAGSGAASPRPNFHPTHPVSSKVCRPFSSRYEDPLKSAKKGRGSSHSETVDCKRGYTLRPEPYSPACPLESRCPTCLAEGAPMSHGALALGLALRQHAAQGCPKAGVGLAGVLLLSTGWAWRETG